MSKIFGLQAEAPSWMYGPPPPKPQTAPSEPPATDLVSTSNGKMHGCSQQTVSGVSNPCNVRLSCWLQVIVSGVFSGAKYCSPVWSEEDCGFQEQVNAILPSDTAKYLWMSRQAVCQSRSNQRVPNQLVAVMTGSAPAQQDPSRKKFTTSWAWLAGRPRMLQRPT